MCELHKAVIGTGAKIVDSHTRECGGLKKLFLLTIEVDGKRGAILHFENPPAHQMDTQVLYGYASALERIEKQKNELSFLIFSFAPDAIHAGGDLKETLANLHRKEGYRWADRRLLKALSLYKRVRALAQHMRVVSLLAGGEYYGGSAEFVLWADYILGDSRSSICMSETTIGLIPGWGGVARLITKSGYLNARCLVGTARKTSSRELKAIGVLNKVIEVPFPLSQKDTTPQKVQEYAQKTLTMLFSDAFGTVSSNAWDNRIVSSADRVVLMNEIELQKEITRRSNPQTYKMLWGKSLADVKNEIATYKKPLAPQSIRVLDLLFASFESLDFDEECFYRMEMRFDAALYRNPLLVEGIRATLHKTVPNFHQQKE